jgi:hypothetical protein
MSTKNDFFTVLLDFSFSEFITPRIIGILYAIGILLSGITALGLIIRGFSQGLISGVLSLLFVPIGLLFYIILIRVGLEGFIVAFRTANNTGRTAVNTESLRQP